MQLQKLDLRSLRVDDWVLVNGKPHQLRSITAKIATEDGEFLLSTVEGIKLKMEDIEAAFTRVCAYEPRLKVEVSDAERYGLYVGLFLQRGEEPLRVVNRPVKYYHELQHALYEAGVTCGLNYHWAERDKEDAEAKAEGEKEASNA